MTRHNLGLFGAAFVLVGYGCANTSQPFSSHRDRPETGGEGQGALGPGGDGNDAGGDNQAGLGGDANGGSGTGAEPSGGVSVGGTTSGGGGAGAGAGRNQGGSSAGGAMPGGRGGAGGAGSSGSCRELHDAEPTLPSGTYPLRPARTAGEIEVYCDMTADRGGWMLVTEAMIAHELTSNVTVQHEDDSLGGVILTVASTVNDCGGNESYLVVFDDVVSWSQIRANYTMSGSASCWSTFGDTTYTNGMTPNLFPFEMGVDTIRNEFHMGGSNGDAFDGVTHRCDNETSNVWHFYNGFGARSAQVLLRRLPTAMLAGLATGVGCTQANVWRYSDIYVR